MCEFGNIDVNSAIDQSSKFFEDMERLLEENKSLRSRVAEQDAIIDDLKNTQDFMIKDVYRTLDLNNKLSDSEEKLKSLNAQKDKFFSIIAHDLRNPIANFEELTSVLAQSFDEFSKEELNEFINDLARTSKHLYSLLENLLEWSRSQTGRIPYNPINIYLAQLVDNNFSLLEISAKNKNITLVSEISDSFVVYVDPNMIYTVIRNLISNAIKFTPSSGFIRLTAEYIDSDIQLSVTDSGVGIPEEHIDKLFRIDVFTSTRGTNQEKGTGLGLVLCKEFIEKNNGAVSVESVQGLGTTFRVRLPKANPNFHIPESYIPQYFSEHTDMGDKSAIKSIVNYEQLENRNISEIIEYLENKLYPFFEEAKKTLVISSINKFAGELTSYGKDYNLGFIYDFGMEILKYSEELELDFIDKALEKYPLIIDELKKIS